MGRSVAIPALKPFDLFLVLFHSLGESCVQLFHTGSFKNYKVFNALQFAIENIIYGTISH